MSCSGRGCVLTASFDPLQEATQLQLSIHNIGVHRLQIQTLSKGSLVNGNKLEAPLALHAHAQLKEMPALSFEPLG